MVMPGWCARWARRLLGAARHDLAGSLDGFRPAPAPGPGLFTYRLSPPGGSRIVHLRIEADGRGTLLVDGADAVHLNATAASLASMALDRRPPEEALAALRRPGLDRRQIGRDVRAIYGLVGHLASTTDSCPTCCLDAARRDVFSAAVDAPYKADLALTYGCNNACGHCYNEPSRIATRSLDRDRWKRVIQKLHAVGIPHLVFTGGEPTLHPHLVELVAFAHGLGAITGLNTNGRRLADAQLAHALFRAGLSHVQVTLQSHRPSIHNAMTGEPSFDETVAGIGNAHRAGLHTMTNTTLTRQNAAEAEQVVEFLHALGLKTFAMNGMIRSGSGCGFADAIPEDGLAPVLAAVRDRAAELGMRFLWYTPTPYCRLSPLELGLGPRRCNAAQYTIAIEPDGAVLPCQSCYRPAGNILASSWSEIWNNPLFLSFRRRVEQPQASGLPETCWDCPDLPVCAGGCPLNRGSLPPPQPGRPSNPWARIPQTAPLSLATWDRP
ncbi:MAG: radical SAM protein [Thermoguttaceae bacterium]